MGQIEQIIGKTSCNGITLYHGSKCPIENLRPDFEYRKPPGLSALVDNPNADGAIFGRGLYCTPDRQAALDYSLRHQPGSPIVITIQPDNVPVYDFRDNANPLRNGNIPPEIIRAWQRYFFSYLAENQIPTIPDRPGLLEAYQRFLKMFSGENIPGITIEELLGTSTKHPVAPNGLRLPPWAHIFTGFVEDELGTDGIVVADYTVSRRRIPTYVFTKTRRLKQTPNQ